MAGAFTHWMVVESAMGQELGKAQLNPGHQLAGKVLQNADAVRMGAISPDMPYLTVLHGGWADRMHYEKIDGFVQRGVGFLVTMKTQGALGFDQCLAWFLGYVAHVVTDVVVHPVVNAIVGPYLFNKTDHRRCEMVQDTYIFHALRNQELVQASYFNALPAAAPGPICNLWQRVLEANHSGAGTPNPGLWYGSYRALLNAASSGNVPAPFRHALDGEAVFYGTTNAFQHTDDHYYSNIPLPRSDRRVDFREVFDVAVREVVRIWGELLTDIDSGNQQRCGQYVKNWDLDLGIDQGALDLWA